MTTLTVLNSDKVQGTVNWMAGALNGRSWTHVQMILPYSAIGIIGAFICGKYLNILALGDDVARGLGMHVEKSKIILVILAALLAASAVSVAGMLGFVGLVIPHITRLIIGSDNRFLIPFSAIFGAVTVILADTTARTLFSPYELPVGVVMAFAGAPFFPLFAKTRIKKMKYFSCSNLKTGYNKKSVIHDISISFNKSEITSIIGPNGSGKSTLLKSMGRLLKPISGKIYINDRDITTYKESEIAKHIGVLPQAPSAPMDIPVHCLVAYGRNPHKSLMSRFDKNDMEIVNWAIESTGLQNKRFQRIGQLSGGERQRAWVAMSLAQQPKILLLDEPTTYLDIHHQFEVLELLERLNKECGLTVIMVLHDLNLASRFSDRIIALKDGNLFKDGTPEDVLTEKVISDVFNIRSQIMDIDNNLIAVPMGVA